MFLPYVYIVKNRYTKQFYIGMRSANKVVAEQDLGIYYFTSSKTVKNNFLDYDIEIVAYFIDQISAFEFENELIKKYWGDPLLLNRHYQKSMSRFSMQGAKRADVSEFNRRTKSKPKENRIYKCRHCGLDIKKLEFCHRPPKKFYYCNASCRNKITLKNKKASERKTSVRKSVEFVNTQCENCAQLYLQKTPSKSKFKCCSMSCRMKIALKNGGHPAWNKGLTNPLAAENGRKGAKKQSEKVRGRKRKYLENGNWTWEYPTTSVTE